MMRSPRQRRVVGPDTGSARGMDHQLSDNAGPARAITHAMRSISHPQEESRLPSSPNMIVAP